VAARKHVKIRGKFSMCKCDRSLLYSNSLDWKTVLTDSDDLGITVSIS
jgi:hypothetical protein